MEKFSSFTRIAEVEFSDIVISTQDLGQKLRIYFCDKSFVDFFYTTRTKSQRFSLHWEKTHIDGKIYRVDNTPDKKWQHVARFPIHFHNTTYANVENSPFTIKPKDSLQSIFREFLAFVKMTM